MILKVTLRVARVRRRSYSTRKTPRTEVLSPSRYSGVFLSMQTKRLGELNELPRHRLAAVRRHDLALGDRRGRGRRADHLPDATLRAAFARLRGRADGHSHLNPLLRPVGSAPVPGGC